MMYFVYKENTSESEKGNMKKAVLSRIAILSTVAAASVGTMYHVQTRNTRSVGFSSIMERNQDVFEKEKTPVTNMVIVLKILNNSALCDHSPYGDSWDDEVKQCIAMLDSQITSNADVQDAYTKEMLRLQQILVNDLQAMKDAVSERTIDNLEDSYHQYHAYYDQNYPSKAGQQS